MLRKSKLYLRQCALIIIIYGDIGVLRQIHDRIIHKEQNPLVDLGVQISYLLRRRNVLCLILTGNPGRHSRARRCVLEISASCCCPPELRLTTAEVITLKMAGIREIREKSAAYLSGSEPFFVTQHGKISGVYIPLESPNQLPDDWRREIGKLLSLHFAKLLEAKGISERDIWEDFRAYRGSRLRR